MATAGMIGAISNGPAVPPFLGLLFILTSLLLSIGKFVERGDEEGDAKAGCEDSCETWYAGCWFMGGE